MKSAWLKDNCNLFSKSFIHSAFRFLQTIKWPLSKVGPASSCCRQSKWTKGMDETTEGETLPYEEWAGRNEILKGEEKKKVRKGRKERTWDVRREIGKRQKFQVLVYHRVKCKILYFTFSFYDKSIHSYTRLLLLLFLTLLLLCSHSWGGCCSQGGGCCYCIWSSSVSFSKMMMLLPPGLGFSPI